MTTHTPSTDTLSTRNIITVTELNQRARRLLEVSFNNIWVEGEISNLAVPSSGHWYFTLKDSNAQVRCAFFKNRNRRLVAPPEPGSHVLVRARVSLYEGRGDYQLIVDHMELAGAGALALAFAQLKTKLEQEGLFAQERKQQIPDFPRHLGVITSPTGAALHDILSVLKRRYPQLPVTVFPTQVQGDEAAPQIVQALQYAEQFNQCDLLIVGRGGGSMEDLWPFNEEIVARAIAECPLPVISAVGHEVDFCISDFVADLRAPTPSAAAELASPDRNELKAEFDGYAYHLQQLLKRQIQMLQQQLDHLRQRLRHPGHRLQELSQRLDDIELRMSHSMQNQLLRNQAQLQNLSSRLKQRSPEQTLKQLQLQLSHLNSRLQQGMEQLLRQHQQRLAALAHQLELVSPLATLSRGYAIVETEAGEVVRKATEVTVGERVKARLGEGSLHCIVESTH